MSLCELCGEGKVEMCEYFKENFLESGEKVASCPKFWPEKDGSVEVVEITRADKVRVITSRSIRKAMSGERVLMLTKFKTAQADLLMQEIEESDAKKQVASVRVHFKNGGEVWIGGA